MATIEAITAAIVKRRCRIGDLAWLTGNVFKAALGRVVLVKHIERKDEDHKGHAFGKSARNGSISFFSYARWFDGLQKNQQAFSALMATLPPSARSSLPDLFVVADGISKATRERITTGRLSEGMRAIEKQLEPADTLMARVYGVAAKSTGEVAAEAISTTVGLPGGGHRCRDCGRAARRAQAERLRSCGQDVRIARLRAPRAHREPRERAAAVRQFVASKIQPVRAHDRQPARTDEPGAVGTAGDAGWAAGAAAGAVIDDQPVAYLSVRSCRLAVRASATPATNAVTTTNHPNELSGTAQ